jgi:hypothetical protein
MTSKLIQVPLNLRSGPARSSGIHLSAVLRAIAIHLGTLKAYEEDLDEIMMRVSPENIGTNGTLMRICIGYAWEAWIAKQVENLIQQPGELQLDGVFGTPDGLSFDGAGNITLHEIKATFKSSKGGIEKVQLWIWQAAAYLKMLQVKWGEECRTVVFHPLYIRGDYKGIDPQYLPTEITFEQAEIESVWDMVKRNKHLAVPEKGQAQQ